MLEVVSRRSYLVSRPAVPEARRPRYEIRDTRYEIRTKALGRSLVAAALTFAALSLAPAPARGADPLNTVRAFCQADGRGDRIDPRRWMAVADLVTWPLEPAWDHLYLIRGFELGMPQRREGGVDVEVQYTITGDVHSSVVTTEERVEKRVLTLVRGDDGVWRIRAPAPPPYLFASEADDETLAALLAPDGSSYLSNSAFVWRMLRSVGWTMPYADTAGLASSPDFTSERTAEVGDLVLYYDGEQPYHVGLVESEETIVSATLNGGIRRTPFGAFAGEIRYRRPVASAMATPTPLPTAPPRHGHKKR